MLSLTQSMENLYGAGNEGPPHSVEECEEGECLCSAGQGRQEVAGAMRGWTSGLTTSP